MIMFRALQPLLADALKSRRTSVGLRHTIDGPLTWKSFHHLLHVQNQYPKLEEQSSGPQPIPYVIAGLDREWIMLAPYGLKYWDKLSLVPYSKRKDLVYIAVLPDNDYICSMTKIYLRELSAYYELCQLGSHKACSTIFPDQGLCCISEKNYVESIDETTLPDVDPWFTDQASKHRLGHRLKLYARILKAKLSEYKQVDSNSIVRTRQQASTLLFISCVV
jgi:hypothetical protein